MLNEINKFERINDFEWTAEQECDRRSSNYKSIRFRQKHYKSRDILLALAESDEETPAIDEILIKRN